MPRMKIIVGSLLLLAAFLGGGRACYAQGVDTIVEIPTAAHNSAIIEIPTSRGTVGNSNSDDRGGRKGVSQQILTG